jgi:hypothetical protein
MAFFDRMQGIGEEIADELLIIHFYALLGSVRNMSILAFPLDESIQAPALVKEQLFRKLQRAHHLLARYRWEGMQKRFDRFAGLQIIEKILDRHARTAKYWSAA